MTDQETPEEAAPANAQGPEEPGLISARRDPGWLNPATVKGAVLVVAGLLILFTPELAASTLRLIVGGGLIAISASDLWFMARGEAGEARLGLGQAVVALVAGIGLLLIPGATIRVVAIALGAVIGLRGVVSLGRALRRRRLDEAWAFDAVRSTVMIALGLVLLVLPGAVLTGVVIFAAAGAIVAGAILISYGLQHHSEEDLRRLDAGHVTGLVRHWLNERDLGDYQRDTIADTLYFEPPDRFHKLVSWWVMLLLSVAIATFAVLQDSTAVVIGAMLIAPLMTPIMGTAAAIVNGWFARVAASVILVAAGVGAAIGLAWVIAGWFPALVPLASNSQVLSRTSPTLLDMAIAIAAGAAGAYATVDSRVSSSLPGVAIAVALVPPLAVVGITLEAGDFGDAGGAFLLFLTNFVSIILAAVLVFVLTGFAPVKQMQRGSHKIRTMLLTVVVGALLIMVPLGLTAEDILSKSQRSGAVTTKVDEWLGEDADLVVRQATISGSEVTVVLTGPGEVPSIEQLQDELAAALGDGVKVIVEHVPSVVVIYSDEEGRTVIGSGS